MLNSYVEQERKEELLEDNILRLLRTNRKYCAKVKIIAKTTRYLNAKNLRRLK